MHKLSPACPHNATCCHLICMPGASRWARSPQGRDPATPTTHTASSVLGTGSGLSEYTGPAGVECPVPEGARALIPNNRGPGAGLGAPPQAPGDRRGHGLMGSRSIPRPDTFHDPTVCLLLTGQEGRLCALTFLPQAGLSTGLPQSLSLGHQGLLWPAR